MLSKLHFCVRLPLTIKNWIESGHLNIGWGVGSVIFAFAFGFVFVF